MVDPSAVDSVEHARGVVVGECVHQRTAPGTNRAVARSHCVQGGFTPGVASTVVQPRAGHAASSTQSAPSAMRARHPVITAMPVAVRGGARL